MTKVVHDQIGRRIEFDFPLKRIVSTVPSVSELIFDLRSNEQLVGVTRFCTHPPELKKTKTIIGGTKRLEVSKIIELQPDLIIGIKEENIKTQVDELSAIFPFYIGNVENLQDNSKLILALGEILDRQVQARIICESTDQLIKKFKGHYGDNLRVAYLIWRNPFMVAGSNTYINSVLESLGFVNAFKNSKSRYPITSISELKDLDLDYIFLSSIPFPFKELHLQEFKLHLPKVNSLLVDGEVFSYYGSRLAKSESYLATFLNSK